MGEIVIYSQNLTSWRGPWCRVPRMVPGQNKHTQRISPQGTRAAIMDPVRIVVCLPKCTAPSTMNTSA
jgi:hypothetical protein